MILRNASRSGTITTMRTEYIDAENLTYALESDRVAIQFAPKSVINARKGPGERERLQKILTLLEKSHEISFAMEYGFRSLRKRK